jgi:acetate kinase
MAKTILTINAGSSSIKIGVFATKDLSSITEINQDLSSSDKADAFAEAFDSVIDDLLKRGLQDLKSERDIAAVCHRVVHGGDYTQPTTINDEVLAHLEELSGLAPL